eukprot:240930_1
MSSLATPMRNKSSPLCIVIKRCFQTNVMNASMCSPSRIAMINPYAVSKPRHFGNLASAAKYWIYTPQERRQKNKAFNKAVRDEANGPVPPPNGQTAQEVASLPHNELMHRLKAMRGVNLATINPLFRVYAETHQFDRCEALFNDMCSREHNADDTGLVVTPDEHTFSYIISCIGNCMRRADASDFGYKKRMKHSAIKYYNQMRNVCKVNDVVIVALMNICLQCNETETLMMLFDQHKHEEMDTKVRNSMYNIVVGALFQAGKMSDALQVFEEGIPMGVWDAIGHELEAEHVQRYAAQRGDLLFAQNMEIAAAVVAIMSRLNRLCDMIASCGEFQLPSLRILVLNNDALKRMLPFVLECEDRFYPSLSIDREFKCFRGDDVIKLDDESVLRYCAHQLKMDIEELRTRFQPEGETVESRKDRFNWKEDFCPDLF